MRRQRIKTLNKNMKQLLAVIGNWQLTWAQKEGIKNKDGSWLLEKKNSRTEGTAKSQCFEVSKGNEN